MAVKVTIDLGKLEGLAAAAAERGLQKAQTVGVRRLKADILNQHGEGRIYRRGKKATHQASAPGAAPAPDFGHLRDKTTADPTVDREGSDLVGRISVNTSYAHALEVGTERVAARPYLSKLRSEHRDELVAAFNSGAKGE